MLVVSAATAPAAPMASEHAALAPGGRWSAYGGGHTPLPPMGWSSWNAYGTRIDQARVMSAARMLLATGLAEKGYRYVNIDDGWARRRDADGRLVIDPDRFPDAALPNGGSSFRKLTAALHAIGLKAGIYSDLGRNTCSQAHPPPPDGPQDAPLLPRGTVQEREVGLHDHLDSDLKTFFVDWNFDFIKVDGCGLRAYGPDAAIVRSGLYRALPAAIDQTSAARSDIGAVRAEIDRIGTDLARDRPLGDTVFSLCLWGAADVRRWGKDVANSSRTSIDLAPRWTSLLTNVDSVVTRALYAHPGAWNDPDMLYLGVGEFDAAHPVEARSHLALWAMLAAPLMIGVDPARLSPALLAMLGNRTVIGIDQDPEGNQATLAYDAADVQILTRRLASGDKAVAVFDRGLGAMTATVSAAQLRFRSDRPVVLTDAWTGRRLSFTGTIALPVGRRETLLFVAHGVPVLSGGVFLSDVPGRVNPAVDGVTEPREDPAVFRATMARDGTTGPGVQPAYAGWGGARADATPYGRPIRLRGAGYTAGIGVLANSRLEVRAAGERWLESDVGVDDSAEDAENRVVFSVFGDRRLLARSPPMRRGDTPQALRAHIDGVRIVELVATSVATDDERLPVDWAGARLLGRAAVAKAAIARGGGAR